MNDLWLSVHSFSLTSLRLGWWSGLISFPSNTSKCSLISWYWQQVLKGWNGLRNSREIDIWVRIFGDTIFISNCFNSLWIEINLETLFFNKQSQYHSAVCSIWKQMSLDLHRKNKNNSIGGYLKLVLVIKNSLRLLTSYIPWAYAEEKTKKSWRD